MEDGGGGVEPGNTFNGGAGYYPCKYDDPPGRSSSPLVPGTCLVCQASTMIGLIRNWVSVWGSYLRMTGNMEEGEWIKVPIRYLTGIVLWVVRAFSQAITVPVGPELEVTF